MISWNWLEWTGFFGLVFFGFGLVIAIVFFITDYQMLKKEVNRMWKYL